MRWLSTTLALAVVVLARPGSAEGDTTSATRAPHPEPRVIIDATARRDTHAAAIQAAARRGFWGKAVGCYRPAVAEDPKLVIDGSFAIEVRDGTIRSATASRPRGGKRGGKARPRPSAEVTACLARRLVGLTMPEGVRTSGTLRVRIAPGDPPT